MTLVDEVVAVAEAAGRAIMAIYASGEVAAQRKADQSPVTAADLAAEAVITPALRRLLPDAALISEESLGDAVRAAATLAQAPRCWLVDPLDGTRDFLARSGEFCVCIGLVEAGVPVLGVVHGPAQGITYAAMRGQGAFLLTAAGERKRLNVRTAPPERFTVLLSRQHAQGEAEGLLAAFPECRVRQSGSALKYGKIAAGEADVAIRVTPTSVWDTAAAQAVLEEAGGSCVDFAGKSLRYGEYGLVNPPFAALGAGAINLQQLIDAIAGR